MCAIVATAVSGISGGTAGVPVLSQFECADSDCLAALVRFRCPGNHHCRTADHSRIRFGRTAAAIAARVYGRRRRTRGASHPERIRHFSACQGFWGTVVPVALLFPMLLWLAARCRPVFATTAALISALTIVLTTTFGIGFFGDATFPISERILGAQASILAVSFCVFVLAALFAERRVHETELVASGTRLHEALTELRLLYENAPDRACVSHSRLPLSANQSPPDGDLRPFNRRSYRQVECEIPSRRLRTRLSCSSRLF